MPHLQTHPEILVAGLKVRVHGVRQDVPPRTESIAYEILVDTDESVHHLIFLYAIVKKYGTVFNTDPGATLTGTLHRLETSA